MDHPSQDELELFHTCGRRYHYAGHAISLYDTAISVASKTNITFVVDGISIEVPDYTKNSRMTSAEDKFISRSFSQVRNATAHTGHRDIQSPQAKLPVLCISQQCISTNVSIKNDTSIDKQSK
jgi:hypothetical protein